jgi:hypothetical protein
LFVGGGRADELQLGLTLGQSVEPDREVVERAIVELLGIAQRQGITPADLLRMLNSGMRIPDFLSAIDPLTNADPTLYCDERHGKAV